MPISGAFRDEVDFKKSLLKRNAKVKLRWKWRTRGRPRKAVFKAAKGGLDPVKTVELIDLVGSRGIEVSERSLQRWAAMGLIPRPRKEHLGRGKGTVNDWPDEAPGEVYATASLLKKRRLQFTDLANIRALALNQSRLADNLIADWYKGMQGLIDEDMHNNWRAREWLIHKLAFEKEIDPGNAVLMPTLDENNNKSFYVGLKEET